MPDDSAESTSATDSGTQPAATVAGADAKSAAPLGLTEHLLADIRTLQARENEVQQRLLDQIERRHAAEAALHAERFKVAALQRDFELLQLRLKSVHASLDALQRERNDLDRALRDIRASLMWRVGKTYWSVTRRIAGR
jgi:chromosome segregation ATPase